MTAPVRIGLLGASKVATYALIDPAGRRSDVVLAAVAARDRARAEEYARTHGIERVLGSYEELVADGGIDAVYNGLPISGHAPWTIAALEAGRHVLCEKPFAVNAGEAAAMVAAGERSGRVLMEAFHWRFHPLAEEVLAVVASGALGRLQRARAVFDAPNDRPEDIRYALALGGGALMDLGCYPVHWLRTFTGEEPTVVSARMETGPVGVDVTTEAVLMFGAVEAHIACSLEPTRSFAASVELQGDAGSLSVLNPLAPQRGNRLTLRTAAGERVWSVEGPGTYDCQLAAFVAAARDGVAPLTGGADAVNNMAAIDAIYRAAGLLPRGG